MSNENRISKEEQAKRIKEDERVTKINDEAYKDKNIKNISTSRQKFKDAKGAEKEKVVEHVLYQNGVVKNRLVALYKNGRLIYNVASKMDKKNKRRKSA